MAFLTELATHLKSVFAKIGHNHDSAYEAKNSNIQTHIGASGNPHGTTKSDVGLANLTNDAQVKKSATSTNGNVVVWSGTTGDTLGSGYGVETTLSGGTGNLPRADAVKNYVDNAVSGVSSSGLKPPVQDLTTLKALDTTNSSTYPDKVLINVENLGLYRLDRDSSDTGDDNSIIQPTTGVGRWIKMASSINAHNNMSQLQGGTTGEYYHVTLAISNALAGTNGTPSGTNKFVTASEPKIAYLQTDGYLPVAYIAATTAEWTAFVNTLNS